MNQSVFTDWFIFFVKFEISASANGNVFFAFYFLHSIEYLTNYISEREEYRVPEQVN